MTCEGFTRPDCKPRPAADSEMTEYMALGKKLNGRYASYAARDCCAASQERGRYNRLQCAIAQPDKSRFWKFVHLRYQWSMSEKVVRSESQDFCRVTIAPSADEAAGGLFDIMERTKIMAERYQSVNGSWPEETDEGRSIKPTPQEAMAGAKRLYRIAMGKPFRGKMKMTSGKRHTWIRRGIFYVNPDQGSQRNGSLFIGGKSVECGGGWHEIVHSISHYASQRLFPNAKNHGGQHAFLEKQLILEVVRRGWLNGGLRRPEKPKEPIDFKAIRHQRVLDRMEAWAAKRKRAEKALRKLNRQRAYYERVMQA